MVSFDSESNLQSIEPNHIHILATYSLASAHEVVKCSRVAETFEENGSSLDQRRLLWIQTLQGEGTVCGC